MIASGKNSLSATLVGMGFGLVLAMIAGCTEQQSVAGVEGAGVAAVIVGPQFVDAKAGMILSAARPLAIADILSVVATKKTIIDHAVSMSTGLDCSTVRSLNGGTYCEKPYENHPPALATLYCYRELANVTCYGEPMPYQNLVAIRPGGRQSTY